MKDHYGRKINYMRLSVTDLCNLRCVYCMPEEGIKKREHQENLSFEAMVDLVKAGVSLGIDKIRLTGGEPLVRRGIVDLVKDLGKIKGIKELTMTSNGILLPNYAKNLKDAGVTRINISLDTFDPKKFSKITRRDKIEEVFLGIKTAIAVGLEPIKLNIVLIKGFNDDEIEKFVFYTKDHALDVRFIELMPLGQSIAYAENQYLSNQEVLRRCNQLRPCKKNDPSSPADYYKLPGAKGRVGLINPISQHFCKHCNRIRITTDGKIKPCLHSDHEIDLLDLRKKGLSYEEILKLAIDDKPEQHHIGDNEKQLLRNMNEIGG